METTVNQRLKAFLKAKKITVNALSKKLDMPQVTVNNYILGKRKVSFELMERMAAKYPDLSTAWLLTGEGPMFNDKDSDSSSIITRPRLPVTAAAGSLSEYIGGIYMEQCEQLPIVLTFPPYDFTMIVKGDSMEPKYEGGDEIACKKVEKIIEWGKTYVVDTNDGAFLKRVYDEDEQNIRCVSYNSEYHDFIVPKCEVNGIYRVVGLLRF
jgi:phage repressor protein C with HTH and peptisase S24 domain